MTDRPILKAVLLTGDAEFIGSVVRDLLKTVANNVFVSDRAADLRDDVTDLNRVRVRWRAARWSSTWPVQWGSALGVDCFPSPRHSTPAVCTPPPGPTESLAGIWSRETDGVVAACAFNNVYGPGMPRDTPSAGAARLFCRAFEHGRVFEDGQQLATCST